ncbi:sulfurtransferase TusA family protein [Alkalihalobacterium elongatum]|uniref:sulfurtransferase TusA family protein n=1 Tax=Alkalihalobacterium elongatum TaxID=2675466 RepID=UPI001C1F62D7|nr:sulfurtransferase TusA family protein [Alkalihalobacterium elongatum]
MLVQENVTIINAKGAFCPGPLVELMKKAKTANGGDVLELWTNEEGSLKDVPEWAKKFNHEYIGQEKEDGYYRIQVRINK